MIMSIQLTSNLEKCINLLNVKPFTVVLNLFISVVHFNSVPNALLVSYTSFSHAFLKKNETSAILPNHIAL